MKTKLTKLKLDFVEDILKRTCVQDGDLELRTYSLRILQVAVGDSDCQLKLLQDKPFILDLLSSKEVDENTWALLQNIASHASKQLE